MSEKKLSDYQKSIPGLEKKFYKLTIKELIIIHEVTGEELPIEIPEDIKIQCAKINAKLCEEEIAKAFNAAREMVEIGNLLPGKYMDKFPSAENYIKSLNQ